MGGSCEFLEQSCLSCIQLMLCQVHWYRNGDPRVSDESLCQEILPRTYTNLTILAAVKDLLRRYW
jgi:hypothetical protein